MSDRWWLSFADPTRPTGEQLLGICIVRAVDMASAIKIAHALKINPGGEVQGIAIDESVAALLSFDLSPYMGRLIPPAEARCLNEKIQAELDN